MIAAVGMPRNFSNLQDFPNLKLIQSTSYMHLGRGVKRHEALDL